MSVLYIGVQGGVDVCIVILRTRLFLTMAFINAIVDFFRVYNSLVSIFCKWLSQNIDTLKNM